MLADRRQSAWIASGLGDDLMRSRTSPFDLNQCEQKDDRLEGCCRAWAAKPWVRCAGAKEAAWCTDQAI